MADIAKTLAEHTKQDAKAFTAIHEHLDRLDKATNNDLIIYKLEELKKDITELKKEMKENSSNYITRTEFLPVRNLVFGMVGTVLTAVILALVAVMTGKV